MHQATNMNFIKLIDTIIQYTLTALAFLLPLFFLPITPDMFEFNKQILLLAGATVMLAAWIAKMILQKTVRLTITPLTLPLFLLAAVTTASAILQSPSQTEAFMGRPTTLLALLVIMLTATSNLSSLAQIKRVIHGLIASATLLSIVAVYQFLGNNRPDDFFYQSFA